MNRGTRVFAGMVAAVAVGGLLTVIGAGLAQLGERAIIFVAYPSLVLIPFGMGLVAALIWNPAALRIGELILHSFFTTLLGLGAGWAVMHEGVVCLVIVSPLLWAMIFVGALCGRIWFRAPDDRLRLCVLPLLALLVAGEPFVRRDREAVVIDEIRIQAPPAKVWPHVLAFPEIPDAPDYWIFRLGLPYPTRTTNGGNFVGADRQCIFSDDIVIQERVAELAPNEKLTFEIVEQPSHPEAYGHLTLHRGQFLLRDNHDGTTTLTGSSWYTLHIRPLWYFDLWTRDMTRAVHRRVMRHIQGLAETGA